MTTWAIITAVLLLPTILGIWPIRVYGNAYQNNAYFIRMKKGGAGQEIYMAIFAQEVAEFWLKWAAACLVALPVAYFTQDHEMNTAFIVFTILFGQLLALPFVRQLELIGHAVEIAYARKHHGTGYEYDLREARSMIRGYPTFKNDTPEELIEAMNRRQGIARFLLVLLALRIRREAASS